MYNTSRLECAVKTIRTLQIIVGAMLTGVTIFMVIALSFNAGPPPGFCNHPNLPYRRRHGVSLAYRAIYCNKNVHRQGTPRD